MHTKVKEKSYISGLLQFTLKAENFDICDGQFAVCRIIVDLCNLLFNVS